MRRLLTENGRRKVHRALRYRHLRRLPWDRDWSDDGQDGAGGGTPQGSLACGAPSLRNQEVAIHVYEKLGFRRTGVVLGKILRNERLLDETHMYFDLRQYVASKTDPQLGAAEQH